MFSRFNYKNPCMFYAISAHGVGTRIQRQKLTLCLKLSDGTGLNFILNFFQLD